MEISTKIEICGVYLEARQNISGRSCQKRCNTAVGMCHAEVRKKMLDEYLVFLFFGDKNEQLLFCGDLHKNQLCGDA